MVRTTAADIGAACLQSLRQWAGFAEAYWWQAPGRPGLGCFGTGYGGWGVQTNQKYLAAMAVLATVDEASPPAGLTRDAALARALAALRFSLATHLTGDCDRTDGTRWGHTWILSLIHI